MIVYALLLVAFTALGRSLLHLLVAAFAGLVPPIFTEVGNLPPLLGLVAGGAWLAHLLMLFVREGDVAVFSLQGDGLLSSGGGKTGAKEGQGDCCDDTFHVRALLYIREWSITSDNDTRRRRLCKASEQKNLQE